MNLHYSLSITEEITSTIAILKRLLSCLKMEVAKILYYLAPS